MTEQVLDAEVPVGTIRERTSRISQIVTLVAVVVPPLGLFSAMGLLWGVAFRWVDVALLVSLYIVCAFGTTIGFHRYFTHKGFKARAPVKAGLEGLVWGGLLRIFLYQHATFSVNSICHMFGRRDYRTRDEARNNWLVALLVFGEGWHNNHHAFPASARHGLLRRQIDVSWWVIRGLEKLRLVWDVKVPDAAQAERRRLPAS